MDLSNFYHISLPLSLVDNSVSMLFVKLVQTGWF